MSPTAASSSSLRSQTCRDQFITLTSKRANPTGPSKRSSGNVSAAPQHGTAYHLGDLRALVAEAGPSSEHHQLGTTDGCCPARHGGRRAVQTINGQRFRWPSYMWVELRGFEPLTPS